MIDSGMKLLADRLRKSAVIAVLVVDAAEDGPLLARALLRGGVDSMELTLRTPAAFGALELIVAQVPGMLAGVGTILSGEQVRQAKDKSAAFGVSPGLNPKVVRAARKAGLPFAPGIATPSDIEGAWELGCPVMKFFPAEPSGGLSYLKSINAPYAHLGISYIPLGGLNAANFVSYLECPEVLAVGGSWIATRELVRARDWDAISRNAEAAVALASRIRKA